MGAVITSRENPQIKRLAALLTQKKARESENRFVLEGVRLCLDALQSGVVPEQVFVTERALGAEPELAVLAGRADSVTVIAEHLAARISDTRTPQGIFCIARPPEVRGEVVIRPASRYLLLERIQDPGNLGSMLRTAAALGADAAMLSGCAELYSPKTLRASMGGVFRLPAAVEENMPRRIAALREAGVRVYAAALRGDAQPVSALSSPGGKAVLIGNEGSGLPDSLTALCDGCVTLPMRRGVQSLGAAVAAGILLWEMGKGGDEPRD